MSGEGKMARLEDIGDGTVLLLVADEPFREYCEQLSGVRFRYHAEKGRDKINTAADAFARAKVREALERAANVADDSPVHNAEYIAAEIRKLSQEAS
jgi:hypothetical protein